MAKEASYFCAAEINVIALALSLVASSVCGSVVVVVSMMVN